MHKGIRMTIDGYIGVRIGKNTETTVTSFSPDEVMKRKGHRRRTHIVTHITQPKSYRFSLICVGRPKEHHSFRYRVTGLKQQLLLPFCVEELVKVFGKVPKKIYVSW